MLDQNTLSQFKNSLFEFTDSAQNIIITSHMGPDDDSISSVLSLYFILHEKYPEKTIRIIYSSERNSRWSYFENFTVIEYVDEITTELDHCDLLIGLDADIYSRFSKSPERLKQLPCKKIVIDHHANPPDEFDLALIDPVTSSNSEILYSLFFADRPTIPPRIAEVILLGILGDTGNLRFINKDQISAFSVVSRLVLEGDIDIAYLESKYSTFSDTVFSLMQELMRSTEIKEVLGWPRFLCSVLSRSYIERHAVTDVDISAARNIFIATYGTRISGVGWSLVATSENDGDVKVSLRSLKDSINVRLLVQTMGIGGGHDRAAGARFAQENATPLDARDAVTRIMSWMQNHSALY